MIQSHKELAKAIQGKSILHLNSLGKDAVICLEWLNHYANPGKIISVFFKFEAGYPTDAMYMEYLKKRYPKTKFIEVVGVTELSEKMAGMFQSPVYINTVINHQEYEEFSFQKCTQELREKYQCDYICSGISCYEGMGRAIYLRRTGLLDEKRKMIFPIGLLKQQQVLDTIKNSGVKLNPSYKFSSESHDSATYYKMRYAFIARPAFKKKMLEHYPMLALDEYRWEKLFKVRK